MKKILLNFIFTTSAFASYDPMELQKLTKASLSDVRAAMQYLNTLERDFDADWQVYHGILPRLINQYNFRIGCEIGVSFGTHCKRILQTTGVEKLYGIDPYLNYGDPTNTKMPDLYFDIFFYKVQAKLSEFGNRFELIRDYSVSAAQLFADSSLDFIFLDANHTFQSVTDDLNAWYSKVRSGGLISGDDYATCHPGVPMAVDIFCQKMGLELHLDEKQPRFWWVIKK